jgi:hypothetical protein
MGQAPKPSMNSFRGPVAASDLTSSVGVTILGIRHSASGGPVGIDMPNQVCSPPPGEGIKCLNAQVGAAPGSQAPPHGVDGG